MCASASTYNEGPGLGLGGLFALLAVAGLVILGILAVPALKLGPSFEKEEEGGGSSSAAYSSKYPAGSFQKAPGLPDIQVNPHGHPEAGHGEEEADRVRDCVFSKGAEKVLTTQTPYRFIVMCREDPNVDGNWLVMVIQMMKGVYTEFTSYAVNPKIAVTFAECFNWFLNKDSGVAEITGGPPWVPFLP